MGLDGLFWMLHQGEKRDTNTVYQKRAQTDWQRSSDVLMNTCCVVHIHKKYLRTQNIHSIKNFFFFFFQRLRTSRQEKKKLYLTIALVCFFIILFFFCFLFSIFGGWKSIKSQFTVLSLKQFP